MPHAKQHFGFFLVPGYSLVALACAIDVLRAANIEIGQTYFKWTLLGDTNTQTTSSSAIASSFLDIDDPSVNQIPLDVIAICGGERTHLFSSSRAEIWLKTKARQGLMMGSLSDGAYLAAKLGLFDQCRSTIHWKCQSAYRELYPDLNIQASIFEVSGNRFSCAGGTASLDLLLHFVAEKFDQKIAGKIADNYFHDIIRGDDQVQHMTSALRFAHRNENLSKALIIMENALENPKEINEIAKALSLSHRQLDRLFKSYLNTSPARHYRELRLLRAANLLKQTNFSVSEIALSCGFQSASHLAKFFKERFATTPAQFRKVRLS